MRTYLPAMTFSGFIYYPPLKPLKLFDKKPLFIKEYRGNLPRMSNQIETHDVVGATHWLKLRAWDRKGADAEMVTGGLDLARRAENRRPLDTGGLYKNNNQTRGPGNSCSRYGIQE
jgi:hypothetical protein